MTGSLANKRILIVEDEFFISDDIKRAVDDAGGVSVGPVGDIEAGLELARHATIDVALLDINLAGTFSYPIADILANRKIPFAFLTGYEPTALPDAHVAVPCVAKPFPITVILDALNKLVATKGAA